MGATSDDLKAFYLSILGTSSSTCSVVYTGHIGYLKEQQTMKFFCEQKYQCIHQGIPLYK